MSKLKDRGIGTQVHYIPVHYQPYYIKRLGYKKGDFPASEKYYDSTLTLPLFPALKPTEQDYVIGKVKEVLK